MMGKHEILMPDVGEGVTEAEITEWNVDIGDRVREDDVLVAIMTDKATVEIPSPVDGTVTAITGEIGDIIAVGTVIVTLDVVQKAETQKQAENDAEVVVEIDATKSEMKKRNAQAAVGANKPLAAPAVRRRAIDAGIDLAQITGSGPDGRISLTDLDAWLENPRPTAQDKSTGRRATDFKEINVTGLRRIIAQHMEAANRRIAHITYVEEVDVTELEILREHLNSNLSTDKSRLTVLPFLMIAVIRALTKNRKLNAHYDDEAGLIRQYDGVHLGMATQTSRGLMVPVIVHAEVLDVWELASEIVRLADAAKSGTIKREELTGSTITLSSLGSMGGLVSTPIINAPEVAIVGVNKIAMRQVWRDGGFIARKIMNLSSSFDHRVVDGWDAATFIQEVKALVENPATLLEEV